MLHILWTIIKILLIILAAALGVILAMLLVVLFCPVRYRAEVKKQDSDIYGQARVSWLFGIVAAIVCYSDKQSDFQIRLFGISIDTYRKMIRRLCSLPKRRNRIKESKDPDSKSIETDKETESRRKNRRTEPVKKRKKPEDFAGKKKKRFFKKLFFFGGKVIRIPGKIAAAICRILKSICGFFANIQKWKAFIEDERVRGAIRIAWEEGKRLLRHIAPRKVTGTVVLGMENPCATGQVYGIFCALCPIHKYIVDVQPVFDEARLDADISLKGRIYMIIPVISGLKLLLDQNIQYVIRSGKKEG